MTTNPHALHFPDTESNGQPKIRLRRLGPDHYELIEEFRYLDHVHGLIKIQPFETDLTSVNWWDSWITPKLGKHLPAVVVHDAMIGTRAYVVEADPNRLVGDDDADRIFHDALAHLGVGAFRRLTFWAAARARTALAQRRLRTWIWVAVAFVSAVFHFLEVIDSVDLHPLIGDWSFWIEWPASALSTFVIGSGAAFVVGTKFLKPLIFQSLIFSLAFMAVLPMVPVLLLMTISGPLLALVVRP